MQMSMVEVLEHLSMTTTQNEAVLCIAESVTTMKQLADSVLDLAKVEAGKLTLELSSFKLSQWLASVGSGFRLVASNKHLQFAVNEAADLPVNVELDSGRLRQVVANLLSNAFKVSDSSHAICVKTSHSWSM
jgi:signal transduction histidine kinase